MTFSNRLAKLAASDPRIAEYEFEAGNDCVEHWLHLRWPWTTDTGPVHEFTVKECLEQFSTIYEEGSQ